MAQPPSFDEWLEKRRLKRASRRRWRKNNPESESERKKRYRARYKEKVVARQKAYEALKKGVLVKPEMCQACGRRRVAGSHHEDYSKPLEVMWLCTPCHTYYDRRRRGEV